MSMALAEAERIAGRIDDHVYEARKHLAEIVRLVRGFRSIANLVLPGEGEELVALPVAPEVRLARVREEYKRLLLLVSSNDCAGSVLALLDKMKAEGLDPTYCPDQTPVCEEEQP